VPLVDLVTREGKNIPTIVQKIVEHVEEEGEGWKREGEGWREGERWREGEGWREGEEWREGEG